MLNGNFTNLIIFALGIVAIVVLTTRYKWHPFTTIFFVTATIGLASGLKPEDVVKYIIDGFSGMMGYIAILAISGILIGEFLDKSGAAITISRVVLYLVGKARTTLAMGISGYIMAVPVMCCDTAFLILSPIARVLATGTGISLSLLSLTLAVGAYTSFKLIPPSAGPLAIMTMYKADFATTFGLAFLMSIPVFMVGFLWAHRCQDRKTIKSESNISSDMLLQDGKKYPSLGVAFPPMMIPVILIVGKAISESLLPDESSIRAVMGFVGHPIIAMPIGVAILIFLNRSIGMQTMSQWTSSAITRSGSILVIVGAGGALGSIIQHTGMGEYLGQLMTHAGIPGILVPFALAMALKITQGSSLVTMFTTPAIVAPVLPALGISPEIATLATCAGAFAVVHVNDSFFWVVTKFANMEVTEGYQCLTILTLLQGIVALATVWVFSFFY